MEEFIFFVCGSAIGIVLGFAVIAFMKSLVKPKKDKKG